MKPAPDGRRGRSARNPPFGAYDPGGDFTSDKDVVIEHLFLPWEDVYLPSLTDADAYAMERNRALLITLEP